MPIRDAPIVAAYLPPPPALPAAPDYASALTRKVAAHYIERPYPVWDRATVGKPTTLSALVAKLGPGAPTGLPVAADILIAGCGTGQEAARWALRCPDARITAIDISPASLAFAADRCAGAGIANIVFHCLDLHEVASLGMSFDAVVCSGVLHHLADPEAGWAALVEVLKPGGVMSLMVYSALGRLPVRRAHFLIADLRAAPLTDAVLRAARERLIREMPAITRSRDFYTLSGVHDLLFHEHEDPFDVTRIVDDMAAFGLDFSASASTPSGACATAANGPTTRTAATSPPGARSIANAPIRSGASTIGGAPSPERDVKKREPVFHLKSRDNKQL